MGLLMSSRVFGFEGFSSRLRWRPSLAEVWHAVLRDNGYIRVASNHAFGLTAPRQNADSVYAGRETVRIWSSKLIRGRLQKYEMLGYPPDRSI
jgi:hypothetical protein